jgi:hypothetical protein
MAVNARQIKVGVNIGTSGSWGTGTANATAVGTGDGHHVRDDLGIQMSRQLSVDDSSGQNFIGSVQVANMNAVSGKIPLYLHYWDTFINPLWALALGTADTTPNALSASTAYTGTFEPATTKTGLYATIVEDKSLDIYEVPGAKFTGFELRSGDMGRMEIDFNFIGDMQVEDSTINTATQTAALTYPTLGLRAFLHQCVFRVNAQGGGALGASDAYTITGLKVTFDQPLDTVQVGGQTTIVEPEESAFPTCTIEVDFPRYDTKSDDFFAAHRSATAYKADLTWTGPVIGTLATAYALYMEFPNIVTQSAAYPVPAGGAQIQPKAAFTCFGTSAAPTGMTGTGPIYVITTGERSADPTV